MGILITTFFMVLAGISLFLIIRLKNKGKTNREKAPGILYIIPVAFLFLGAAIFIGGMVSTIEAGHVGVVTTFGKVEMDKQLPEGLNFVLPWQKVRQYSIQTTEFTEAIEVMSKDGLEIRIDFTLPHRLAPSVAPYIHKNYRDWKGTLLCPSTRSAIRDVAATYLAEKIWGPDRAEAALQMDKTIKRKLNEPFDSIPDVTEAVMVDNLLLRDIDLPAKVTAAIEAKMQADQDAQKMEFILAKETQEAERKRIEAKGIADFQKIVSEGISDKLIKWKGIEATQKLAESNNSKVVIIGSGEDGLPVILGGN